MIEARQAAAAEAAVITVAIVGHTNAGKTSLLRTLLRDSHFGDVSDQAGTTRHVEGGAILMDNKPAINLYDTPGLEDSIGLLSCLEQLSNSGDDDTNLRNSNGHQLLTAFITRQDEFPEFEQEAKVIRQLLEDQLIFYVVDAREPVLGKYRDELRLLSFAAKPVIPVLNFVASERARIGEWQQAFAELNLHAQVNFDTVVFRFEDEKRLLQKMQSLLPQQHEHFSALIKERTQQWQQLLRQGCERAAELIMDCAGYHRYISVDSDELAAAVSDMETALRRTEQRCLKDILAISGFAPNDIRLATLPVSEGEWQADLFDKTLLKRLGLDVSSGLAKGAALGASVDVMVGGLSLGAATALGAVAGALWSAGKRFGRDINARFSGERKICANDLTLAVLWQRQKGLLQSLQSRGHAATQAMEIGHQKKLDKLPDDWKKWLGKMRANPDWSRLQNGFGHQQDDDRSALLRQLSHTMMAHLH